MEWGKAKITDIEKKELQEKLDGFRWSYSRINSFFTCKRMFFVTYMLGNRGESNAFADWGTFMHSIMEMYDKNELALWELVDYYKSEYDKNVLSKFPPNMYVNLNDLYYRTGIEYLENFDEHENELVGAEEKIEFVLDNGERKINFGGIIDRLSKNSDGKLVVEDYKSKKFKSKREVNEYFKQLYIYSMAVKEKYGEYPAKLQFNCFRDTSKPYETEFNEEALENAKRWVFDTVEEIYNTEIFEPNYNKSFCKYICSVPAELCDCKEAEEGFY